MPAISVRDIQVKDDSTCLCADLVAGTHGRGFWILDNVTPLRQAAEARAAQAAGDAYLFKPATAVRVRFGDERSDAVAARGAGRRESAARRDHRLLPRRRCVGPGDARDPRRGGQGRPPLLERRSRRATRIPALDPAAYNKVCQQTPTRARLRPAALLAGAADPAVDAGRLRTGSRGICATIRSARIPMRATEARTGAVPHRTYDQPYSPWAPPGTYTVRLTVDGKRYTQPVTLRLDPRVKTPAAGLAQLEPADARDVRRRGAGAPCVCRSALGRRAARSRRVGREIQNRSDRT